VIIIAQINGLISDKRSGGPTPHPGCDWGSRKNHNFDNKDLGKTITIKINYRYKAKAKVKVNFAKWYANVTGSSAVLAGAADWFGWILNFVRFVGVERLVVFWEQISVFLNLKRGAGWVHEVFLVRFGFLNYSLSNLGRIGKTYSLLDIPKLPELTPMKKKKSKKYRSKKINPKFKKIVKRRKTTVKFNSRKNSTSNYKSASASASASENKSFSYSENGATCVMNNTIFYITTMMMISLTIYKLLLQQSVESNPGPKTSATKMSILTFNTNGLRDKTKLKRLLLKINPIVEAGGFAFLQETHIVDTNYLKLIWKNKFSSNCISTNSAGVIILYNNEYEVMEEYNDLQG